MTRLGRAARRTLMVATGIVVAPLLAAVAAFYVLTSTEWGHQRVRGLALRALRGPVNGTVQIGRIDGDLARGVVLTEVSIRDSAGQPFLSARRVEAGYGLGDLWHQRIDLRHLRLDHPVVVLVQSAAGVWNFDRVFRRSTTASSTPSSTGSRGWGSWIAASDVQVIDGDLTVRSPWRPDTSLTGGARDSAIRVALGADSRPVVTAGPDGLVKTVAAHRVNAHLSALRLADPDDPVKVARVASLATDLAAFRPPDADVRDVVGTFYFTGDSLWFPQARAALPGSRVRGAGEYTFATGDLRLQLEADPAALADLRFLYPRLPTDGAGTAGVDITWRGRSQTYVARRLDVHSGDGRASGTLGLTVADSLVFHDTDVRFSTVDTRLVEQLWPEWRIPRRGVATGRAKLAGPLTALRSDVDLTFDDQTAGRSRAQAVGVVGLTGGFRAQGLAVTLDPLQVALARGAVPSLPVGGTITGRATLDGSTDDSLVATADLVHRQGDSYTHMVATGDVAFAPASPSSAAPATRPSDRGHPFPVRVATDRTPRPRPTAPVTLRDRARRVNLSATFDTVDLSLITKFVPAARLAGRSSGAVRVSGDLGDLAVHSQLGGTGPADSSALTVDGHLDLASHAIGYDLTASARRFDAHAVSPHVPATSITAVATVRGRGTTPATMSAELSADVGASVVDSLAVDTAHIRARIAGGQLAVDTGHIRAVATTADVQGIIGIGVGHDGELRYRVAIDSLQVYGRFLPPDTTTVAPRPGRVADAVQLARADSARLASATDVERAILNAPGPALAVDSPATLRRDVLGGRALATGTVRGTIQRFDVRGDVAGDSVVAAGNTARRLRAEYEWVGGPSRTAPVSAAIHVDSATLAGFAFDSIDGRIDYRSPDGNLRLYVQQTPAAEYVANTHFRYSPTTKEVRYDTLAFRFDTTVWYAPHPGSVAWGAEGLTIHGVELTDGRAGRIVVDGRVPVTPRANDTLRVTVRDFDIGHLATLAESDLPVQGLLSMQGVATGTANDLHLRGNASLSSASIRRLPLPSAYVIYRYDTTALIAHAELSPRGAPSTPFALAEATVPVNLSLTVTGPRILDRPVAADIHLDSLPLDVLPQFTQSVQDLGGRLSGHLTIGGTVRRPDPRGILAVDRGSVTIVSTGTVLRDLVARIHLTRDSATIDSLVARTPATGGRLRLAGVVDRTDTAVLVLNVVLTAKKARLLNTRERGRVDVDANLTLAGPTVAPFVSGSATVKSAVLYLPEPSTKRLISLGDPVIYLVADTSHPAVRRALPETGTLLSHTRMDVDVTVNRNSWVRNKDANVETFTSTPITVTVDRARQAIIVEGTLTTDRGEYTLMGKRFVINKGTATFIGTPDLNPSLQAQGEYDVTVPGREALAIQINIAGSLDSLRLSLTSNAQPPVSQSDLFSYLAFNETQSASLTGVANAGSVVGVASSFVSDQLAGQAVGVLTDQVKGDLARALGADVLAITTGNVYTDIGQNHNAAAFLQNTQLEFGKYFTTQTFVAVQASVAPGAQVIHRVGNNLSVNLSAQPLYLLGPPTLSTTPNTPLTAVFGLALARTWRF